MPRPRMRRPLSHTQRVTCRCCSSPRAVSAAPTHTPTPPPPSLPRALAYRTGPAARSAEEVIIHSVCAARRPTEHTDNTERRFDLALQLAPILVSIAWRPLSPAVWLAQLASARSRALREALSINTHTHTHTPDTTHVLKRSSSEKWSLTTVTNQVVSPTKLQ